jgi:hypothetical protein
MFDGLDAEGNCTAQSDQQHPIAHSASGSTAIGHEERGTRLALDLTTCRP